MAKPNRGKSTWELASHGRGECPVCKRTRVKLLYEQDAGGKKVKVCKVCKAAIKHGKKSIETSEAQA
jgi:ribosomal protein L37AE/L43A